MGFDLRRVLDEYAGQNYTLHEAHVNPVFTKVLRTIGFDNCYVRSSGQYLWDDAGRQYLDMLAGYGVFNIGRNNPEVKQAINDFLAGDLASLVQLDAPLLSGVFAKALKARLPYPLDYVYFTNSGTEGVETAIKFARCATGKAGIVHIAKSFHGLTTGALAINGDEIFQQGFAPMMPEVYTVPLNDLAALEELLSVQDIAAFVVEPIQGKGVNIPERGYLRAAAELCRRHRVLFVVDEVQTGVGRTGKFLAIEHEDGVEPDIVILSKALSAGYVPVGAVLTKAWIFKRVFSSMERSVVHSSTFGQGGLAMVAGLSTLAYVEQHKLTDNARRIGDLLGTRLCDLSANYEFIHAIRWRGLMLAIEFARPQSRSLRMAWDMVHRLNAGLFPQAVTMPLLQDHRILTQTAGHHIDVIKLLPPLVINEDDVTHFVDAFRTVMDDLHSMTSPVWNVLSRMGKTTFKHGVAKVFGQRHR